MAERSWVPGADGSGFGIEHLPYGAVRRPGGEPRLAARIGDHALELAPLAEAGLLDEPAAGAFAEPTLNRFLACGPRAWSATRARLAELLEAGSTELRDAGLAEGALAPLTEVEPSTPLAVGDYVDFYSSIHHATNVGRMLRPDDPLLPNWRRLPVAYHGRSATIAVDGAAVRRPVGQLPPAAPGEAPAFAPEPRLDFELELAFVVGGPAAGPIPTSAAGEHVFGFALLNDWSARSIQAWEYQPLGPFLSKSFATSIAAWITPAEALAPFRVPGPEQDPPPLDYLRRAEDWTLDLDLEVALQPDGAERESVISRSSARHLYWDAAQQLAHATVNGARIAAGDVFASGTISGPDRGSEGCLLELTRAGQQPLDLDGGAERAFLEDGDTVTLRGRGAGGDGRPRLELAPVRGRVEPAG